MAKMNRRAEASRQADEDLLKTAMLLQFKRGHAYVSDLAEELEMNIATAYSAVNKLAVNGYLLPLERRGGRKSNKQSLTFTPEGEALAKKILERHQMVQSWLIRLGVPLEEADAEACHMEHGLTDQTMQILKGHVEMASQFMGGDTPAPEAIREMIQRMKENRKSIGLTASEQIISTIERLGGIEGIERKSALVSRAGGEESLEKLLDLVDSLGGIQALARQKEQSLALDKLVEMRGGVNAVQSAVRDMDRLGGADKVRRLEEMAEKLGGMETLLQILGNAYDSWIGVFQQK